jgi:biopolymer transport protein ExbD
MFGKKREAVKAKLSLAPLLDMIFILLIFFVVTTTFSKLPGIEINRPDAEITDVLPPNNLLIGITKTGSLYINEHEHTLETLEESVSLKFKANPRLSIVLVSDEDVQLKYVITVMDLCKKVGINDIALAEELITK